MNVRITSCSVLPLAILATGAHAGGGTASIELQPNAPIPEVGELVLSLPIAPVPDAVVVALRATLEIVHPWTGDLVARLEAPDGAAIALLDRPGVPSDGFPGPWGCGGADANLVLDDDATETAEGACAFGAVPALAGTLAPFEPLGTLAGRPPSGTWLLRLSDAAPFDVGALVRVRLEVDWLPDCDGDGVPDDCASCPADLDGSGAVDFDDLLLVLGGWGPCAPCVGDLDADGAIGFADLLALLAAWGECG